MNVRHSRGYSLVELMTVVAITGLLAALSVPSFARFLRSSQVNATFNELVADVNATRVNAVKFGHGVSIYSASGTTDWSTGWTISEDANSNGRVDSTDPVVRRHPALPRGYTLLTTGPGPLNAPLTFNGQGQRQTPVDVGYVYFVLCNPDGIAADARTLRISGSGTVSSLSGNTISAPCPAHS